MKKIVVKKIKQHPITETEYIISGSTYSNAPKKRHTKYYTVCKGILLDISTHNDQKYIIIAKNNTLLVNYDQIPDITLAEIKQGEIKSGDKVFVECDSMFELMGKFLPYPHETESKACFVVKIDFNNKAKIFKT